MKNGSNGVAAAAAKKSACGIGGVGMYGEKQRMKNSGEANGGIVSSGDSWRSVALSSAWHHKRGVAA